MKLRKFPQQATKRGQKATAMTEQPSPGQFSKKRKAQPSYEKAYRVSSKVVRVRAGGMGSNPFYFPFSLSRLRERVKYGPGYLPLI